jgi:hypothetical protein
MGEKRETASLMRSFLRTISGFASPLLSTGATVLARTLAPRPTKNDKKIQRATDARADVAMLLNEMEKRMAIPSQKEM